ncbi:MAG: hypothetical protein MI976_12620 [Pseudomonadales bacterium]|nr:hypothetical protein [Pseudomonadales bacterium]
MTASAGSGAFDRYESEVLAKLKASDTPYLGLIDDLLSKEAHDFVALALEMSGGNLKNFEKGLRIAPALFVSYLSQSLQSNLGSDTRSIYECINAAMGRKSNAQQSNEERKSLWQAFRRACKKLQLPVSNRLFGPRYMVDAYMEQAGVPEANMDDLIKQMERYAKRYGLPEQDDITAQLAWYEGFKKGLKPPISKQVERALLNDSQGYYLQRFLENLNTDGQTLETTFHVATSPQLVLDGDELYIRLPKLNDGVPWQVDLDGHVEEVLVKDKEQRYYLESLAIKAVKVSFEKGTVFEFQLWQSDKDNQFAIFDEDTGVFISSHCLSDEGAVFSPGQYRMLSRFAIETAWITLSDAYEHGFFLGSFELASGSKQEIRRGPVTFSIHTHNEASVAFEGDLIEPHSGKSFYTSAGLSVSIKIPDDWNNSQGSYELELTTSDGETSHYQVLDFESTMASAVVDYSDLNWSAGVKRVIGVLRRKGEKRVLARKSALVWCGLNSYGGGFKLDLRELPITGAIDLDASNNIRIDGEAKTLAVIDPDLPFVEICFNLTNRQKTTLKFALPGTFIYISDLKDGFRLEQLLPLGSTLSCSYNDTRRLRIFSTDECQLKLGPHTLHHSFDKKRWFKTSLMALLDKIERDQNTLTLNYAGYAVPLLKIVSPHYVAEWDLKSGSSSLDISFSTPAGFARVDVHATNLLNRSEQFISLNVNDLAVSDNSQFGGMLVHQDAATQNQMVNLSVERVPDGLWLLEFMGAIDGKWGRFTNERHDHLGAGVVIENGHIVPFGPHYYSSIQALSGNDKQQLFEITNSILQKCFELKSWQSMHWIKDIWRHLLKESDVVNPDQLSRLLTLSQYRASEEDSPSWIPQVHMGGFNPSIYCGPSKSYRRVDAQNSVPLKSVKVMGEAGSSLANTLRTELLDVALVAAFENRQAVMLQKADPKNLLLPIIQGMLPSLLSESHFKSILAGDWVPALGDMLGGRHFAFSQYEFLMKSRSAQQGNEYNRPTLNSMLYRFARDHEHEWPMLIPEEFFECEDERELLVAACCFSSLFAKQCRAVFWENQSLDEFFSILRDYLNDSARLENILSFYLGVSGNLFHYYLLLWDVYFISRQETGLAAEAV